MPEPTTPQGESQFQRMEKIVWGSLDPTTPQEDEEEENGEEGDD